MPDGDDKGDSRGQDCHHRELALSRRADGQLGLVSQEQLYELGFTLRQIRRRVAQGRLHPQHHNVYAVGHRQLVTRAYLLAALLSIGPRSFLSHRTAAAVWGLRPINTHEIELTLPGTGGRRRTGLIVHRTQTQPHPDDVRINGHLRVSSVLRLLVELTPRERPAELERLVTVAVQKRLLRPDARDGLATVEAALARYARWPGMSQLAGALAGYRRTESHKSQLEFAFDRVLRGHPEIPDPERNIYIDGWEVDRCWRAQKLVVELDGRPYHVAVRDLEKDRVKDAALQRLGFTPIRFTDFRVEHDLPGILSDLYHFLGIT
jgi:very-short-patch-repair endonuclease